MMPSLILKFSKNILSLLRFVDYSSKGVSALPRSFEKITIANEKDARFLLKYLEDLIPIEDSMKCRTFGSVLVCKFVLMFQDILYIWE